MASPGLSSILTTEQLMKLIEDPEVVEALLEHLPDGQKTPEGLAENISSPQFRQSLGTLT